MLQLAHIMGRAETTTNDWAHTATKVVKFTYKWSIENFCVYFELNDKLQSPIFPEAAAANVQWYLELIKNEDVCDNEYLTLRLRLAAQRHQTDKAKVRCSILNQEETEQGKYFKFGGHANSTATFQPFVYLKTLKDNSKNYLQNDKLTIFCEINVLTDTSCTCGKSKPIIVPHSKISGDYSKLLHNKKYSDVIIVTSTGQEIYAHKNILSARCEVFEAMFDNEMDESLRGRVTITDVYHDVLMEMLQFIYTDTAPFLDRMAKGLLIAADKYLLQRLKAMCEESLYTKLSDKNAAKTLITADTYNALQLKARTIEYIIANLEYVSKTEGWENMSQTHPDLIKEHFVTLPCSSRFAADKANYRKFSCEKCG